MVWNDKIEIPKELKEKVNGIKLFINMMYINGIGFLTTVSHPLYY